MFVFEAELLKQCHSSSYGALTAAQNTSACMFSPSLAPSAACSINLFLLAAKARHQSWMPRPPEHCAGVPAGCLCSFVSVKPAFLELNSLMNVCFTTLRNFSQEDSLCLVYLDIFLFNLFHFKNSIRYWRVW